MTQYNMLDAKNNLSKICKAIQKGEEEYVLIANNGVPVAKIIPYDEPKKRKAGCLAKKYKYKGDAVDWFNDDITKLFNGENK